MPSPKRKLMPPMTSTPQPSHREQDDDVILLVPTPKLLRIFQRFIETHGRNIVDGSEQGSSQGRGKAH